eukprot:jgi/Chrpa1/22930/Chrysochromulina_OHIO_Genome00000431-RA
MTIEDVNGLVCRLVLTLQQVLEVHVRQTELLLIVDRRRHDGVDGSAQPGGCYMYHLVWVLGVQAGLEHKVHVRVLLLDRIERLAHRLPQRRPRRKGQ